VSRWPLPSGFGAVPTGLRRERVISSPRFHDGRFENTDPVASPMKHGQMWSTTGEYFFGGRGVERRPTRVLPVEDPRPVWARPVSSGLRITWLGHSTTLLEIDGLRVLTDPVWGERVSPVSFVGPRRFHPPPVSIEGLPPLDAVLVSHDHFDHLDHTTIRQLAKRETPFVTSLGVGAHLDAWGVAPERITELDWWESASVGPLRFHATPARHFSGRGFGTTNGTFWSSWIVETDRRRIFFSGDTGLTPEFEEIGRRLGPFDLVMLEVGAYHPAWGSIHLGPDNALIAHQLLGGGTLMPVHWGTFDLALHAWDEPAERLAVRASQTGARLVTPRLGRPIEPAHVESVDPWWREAGRWHERAADLALSAAPDAVPVAAARPAQTPSLGERAVDELNAH
jgi:L-ascorbate metabolism protein UlaG (beta-lactamase superfamily)